MNSVIVDNLQRMAVRQLIKWIISKAAFLGMGPFPTVLSLVLSPIVEAIFRETVIGTLLLLIDFFVWKQKNKLVKVFEKIGKHEGELTDAQADAYNDELAEAYFDLFELK
jgi:hypothetical protein